MATLRPLDESSLPRTLRARLSWDDQEAEEAFASGLHLAWQEAGTGETVVGDFWRRRADIFSVEQLRSHRHSTALIGKLREHLVERGGKLLVVGNYELQRDLAPFRRAGFTLVNEIVVMSARLPVTAKAGAAIDMPDGVKIRPLRHTDLPALVTLDHAAFPWIWRNSEREFRWYLSHLGVYCHVAEDQDGRLIGYASYTVTGRHGHLDRLAVRPERIGKGIGRELLFQALQRLHKHGVDSVALTTQDNNERAAALYRAFGFGRTGQHYPLYGIPCGAEPDHD